MRGRGIDFEHRFNTSRWAEELLIAALGPEHGLLTVRFGLSVVVPEGQLLYGYTTYKEPDLLVFARENLSEDEQESLSTVDVENADRMEFAEGGRLQFAFHKALAAVEVEFSPYRSKEMKHRYWQPRTLEQWNRRALKNANPPTAPNVFVKEEDLPRLAEWEDTTKVPILVAHLFDQEAFAVALKTLRDFNTEFEEELTDRVKLQVTSGIFKKMETYNRVDAQGAAERKMVFRVAPSSAVKIGDLADVKVAAQLGVSASKKYVTHAIFSGGTIKISDEFLRFLRGLRQGTSVKT